MSLREIESDLLWFQVEERSWKIFRCLKAENSPQWNLLPALALRLQLQQTQREGEREREFYFLRLSEREKERDINATARKSYGVCSERS